ncbi:MAG: hypothetical protein IKB64_02045 [Paludibacteraceae bacterium]|nr:hypothetical protein [Paludibacteraceae bacterium]
MKAGDYVKVLDAVKGLEASSYRDFDMLWKKLWETRGTNRTLTNEEFEMMNYLIRAMQDLGFVRGVLEKIGGEE